MKQGAADVIRHLNCWKLSDESTQVLGATASLDLLAELISRQPYIHRKLNVNDSRKPVDNKEHSAAKVANTFEPPREY